MKTVRYTEKQQERYKNMNVQSASILIQMTTKNGYSQSQLVPNYENIQVKGILNRHGKDSILFNESLKNLLYLSEWDSPIFEFLKGVSNPLLLDGPNVSGIDTYVLPLKFEFGGIINLDGDDELTLEVTCSSGSFNTVGVDETKSFIQFDIVEGVGLEVHTPFIKSRTIEANQSNPSFDLGDNVMEIVIANYDKTNFLKSQAVINNISVDSDKWSRNDSYEEMICRNFGQFTDYIQGSTRRQSFRVYSGYELDGVKLNLNLNTSNVNPSQNHILWYCFETNDKLVTKAAVKHKKFYEKNNRKGQFNPSLV